MLPILILRAQEAFKDAKSLVLRMTSSEFWLSQVTCRFDLVLRASVYPMQVMGSNPGVVFCKMRYLFINASIQHWTVIFALHDNQMLDI